MLILYCNYFDKYYINFIKKYIEYFIPIINKLCNFVNIINRLTICLYRKDEKRI